jgi:hypothetical protein
MDRGSSRGTKEPFNRLGTYIVSGSGLDLSEQAKGGLPLSFFYPIPKLCHHRLYNALVISAIHVLVFLHALLICRSLSLSLLPPPSSSLVQPPVLSAVSPPGQSSILISHHPASSKCVELFQMLCHPLEHSCYRSCSSIQGQILITGYQWLMHCAPYMLLTAVEAYYFYYSTPFTEFWNGLISLLSSCSMVGNSYLESFKCVVATLSSWSWAYYYYKYIISCILLLLL